MDRPRKQLQLALLIVVVDILTRARLSLIVRWIGGIIGAFPDINGRSITRSRIVSSAVESRRLVWITVIVVRTIPGASDKSVWTDRWYVISRGRINARIVGVSACSRRIGIARGVGSELEVPPGAIEYFRACVTAVSLILGSDGRRRRDVAFRIVCRESRQVVCKSRSANRWNSSLGS